MGDLSDRDYGFMSVVAEARGAYRKWNEAEEECIRLRAEVGRLTVEVGKQADELLTAWAKHELAQTEALAARPKLDWIMRSPDQHLSGNDRAYRAARAANEKGGE